jgi:hypothetical protein
MVLEEVRKERASIKPPLEPEGASRMQFPQKVPEMVSPKWIRNESLEFQPLKCEQAQPDQTVIPEIPLHTRAVTAVTALIYATGTGAFRPCCNSLLQALVDCRNL